MDPAGTRRTAALGAVRTLMLALIAAVLLIQAQDPPKKQDVPVDEMTVVAPKAAPPPPPAPPPAHKVDVQELERFTYDDPNRVLRQVSGVSIREEDGFGLRPNIGMRGTSPERSAKITLMEDGILFAPAPYAAPAAYYYPLQNRIVGVEAYTGPDILRFGPLTTGGALNLKTRDIPDGLDGSTDFAGGSHAYRMAHLWSGYQEKSGETRVGFLVDLAHVASEGFKKLDGGGDTGFEKTEVMVKGAVGFGAQQVRLKIGYSEEESDETYLGLSDDDFAEDPVRRYRGSQLDRMEWDRTLVELSHEIDLGSRVTLETAAYHHDFDRVWGKLNRFRNGPDLNAILANPTQPTNAVYYAVLTGAQDSGNSDEHLMIGTNDRRFLAQGIQTELRWGEEDARGRTERGFLAGARFHMDEAVRFHTEDAYRMDAGDLVFNGSPPLVTTDTKATAEALALHAGYAHRFGDVLVAPRVRAEFIRTNLEDDATGEDRSDSSSIILPGLQATWDVAESWTVRAGVYRGFSPKAPGQLDEIDPETSIVYDAGAAVATKTTRASVTAFLNDYENLLAEDTLSGGGSGTGEQFNGGEVRVFGVEVDARHDLELSTSLKIPLNVDYTYQSSEFLTTFSSDNPQFGDVESGDELPYLPEHQLTVSAGLQGPTWEVSILANYVSFMREEAGTGEPDRYLKVPGRTVVDVAVSWAPDSHRRFYVKVLNLLDEEYLVSHRPFGARPGAPLQVQAGFELGF